MGFRAEALQHPDKPAIIMVENDETVSYGQLSDRADQYANYFRRLGFETGDGIAFTIDNRPESCAICIGALRAGLSHRGLYVSNASGDPLHRTQCPQTVNFIEKLPRHSTGKLYKRLLRDPYWSANANPQ